MQHHDKKHVVIDARVVVSNQSHGIARYTEEIVRNLKHLNCALRFTLLVHPKSPLIAMSWPEHFTLRVLKTGWMSWLGQLELYWHLRQLKPNLFHAPSFIVPFLSNAPLVTTIHDLNHVVLSENYSIFHRLYYSVLLSRKIKKAKAVITVSEFSRNEIVNFFHTALERVTVIHNGISENFQDAHNLHSQSADAILRKYELPERYILSVGNKKPHKNIARLVEAWCISSCTTSLVLLSEFDPSLVAIAERAHKKHNLYFLRFVPNEFLPVIYSRAELFIYPSMYEGFGLPPLEAVACGTPVIVSNCSSMPEVMRSHATYIDPSDTENIARTIEKTMEKLPHMNNQNSQAGQNHARQFSWLRAARETLDIFENVLDGVDERQVALQPLPEQGHQHA